MIKKIVIDDNFYKVSKEKLVFFGFLLYYISQFYYTTKFTIPTMIIQLAKYGGLFLICVKIIAFDRYSSKRWLILFALACMFAISAFLSTYKVLLEYIIVVMGFKDINYKKIISFFINVCTASLIFTIICCKLGLVKNVINYRANGAVRQSLGIVYPTDLAAYFFYLFAAFLCINETLEKKDIAILFIGLFFLYRITDARLDCISIAILYAIFIVLPKIDEDIFNKKVIKYGLIFMFVICAIFSITITAKFNPNNRLYRKVNTVLSDRLYWGKEMLNQNGIKLFGQEIKEKGGHEDNNEEEYAFIDCSYLKILLKYGVVPFLVVCYFTINLSCQLYNRKMYKILMMLIMILINSMVAQHYLEIAYNFMIPLLLCDFSNMDQMKLKERNG